MNTHPPSHGPDHPSDQDSEGTRETSRDELLSAYLDGELTAEETEAVEAQLGSSEESRRSLDDLRSLSTYLSDFPVASVPGSLQLSFPASRPTPRPPARSYRAPLVAAVVAAALVVVVAVIPRDSNLTPDNQLLQVNAENAMTGGDAEFGPAAASAMADSTPESDAGVSGPIGGEFAAGGGGVLAGKGKLVFDKSLDNAEVGQILSAIDTSDDQAVVVRLTVVDIEQGLNSLRLLLQKHHIARADAAPAVVASRAVAEGARTRPDSRDRSQPVDDHLVSVVVQASPEQVTQAMSQLRLEIRAEMALAGVLQVAALESAPGGHRALSQLNAYGNNSKRSRKPRSAPDGRRSKANGGKLNRIAESAAADQAAPALSSAQVRLDLPAKLMRQVNLRSVDIKRSATRGVKKRANRQMQIVFVLVTAPRPAAAAGSDPDGAA